MSKLLTLSLTVLIMASYSKMSHAQIVQKRAVASEEVKIDEKALSEERDVCSRVLERKRPLAKGNQLFDKAYIELRKWSLDNKLCADGRCQEMGIEEALEDQSKFLSDTLISLCQVENYLEKNDFLRVKKLENVKIYSSNLNSEVSRGAATLFINISKHEIEDGTLVAPTAKDILRELFY
jgi:hypothetical protein